MDIFNHTAKTNKKIKRPDQILPEVYGTTLNHYIIAILSFVIYYFQQDVDIFRNLFERQDQTIL
jgi:hypothetical protein